MIRTLRGWWHQPDHYYWITASLAAHGFQRSVSRFIALFVLVRGTIPVLMIWSPAGPHGLVGRGLAVLVFVSSLFVAIYWRKSRWPTRNQSLVFAVLLAVGICAGALTRTDPVSGAMASMLFAALAGYIAFFHTARYLILMLIAAAATALYPIARLAATGDLVWAVSLFVSSAIAVVTVAFLSQVLVHLLGIKVLLTDIEPVTGLLNRDAFTEATGALIAARSRLADRHLVIVVACLDHFALITESGGRAAGERARVAAARALKETTRHDAIIAHLPDNTFLVADSFLSTDSSPLVERIRSTLKSTPGRMTVSVGVVCTPTRELASCPPYDLVAELLSLATAAAREAQQSGGNAVKYIVCERPAVLDEQSIPLDIEDAC